MYNQLEWRRIQPRKGKRRRRPSYWRGHKNICDLFEVLKRHLKTRDNLKWTIQQLRQNISFFSFPLSFLEIILAWESLCFWLWTASNCALFPRTLKVGLCAFVNPFYRFSLGVRKSECLRGVRRDRGTSKGQKQRYVCSGIPALYPLWFREEICGCDRFDALAVDNAYGG